MDQLPQYMPEILLAYAAFVLGTFSPGPNILAVIGTSMSRGRREGKALALGVATGSLLWGLFTWFGLTTVLTLYASVLTIIKIAGALYLLWLAFKRSNPPHRHTNCPLGNLVSQGVLSPISGTG